MADLREPLSATSAIQKIRSAADNGGLNEGECYAIWRAIAAQPAAVVDPERVAQLIAHRACTNEEHAPLVGKLSGYCVVCGVPWPCGVVAPQPDHFPDAGKMVDEDKPARCMRCGWEGALTDNHECRQPEAKAETQVELPGGLTESDLIGGEG